MLRANTDGVAGYDQPRIDRPLRAGYSFGEQPIPESKMMFNILAPGVIEQRLTFGFTRRMCCGEKEFSTAVTHALSNGVNGPNPMEVPGQRDIDLQIQRWEFIVGFTF